MKLILIADAVALDVYTRPINPNMRTGAVVRDAADIASGGELSTAMLDKLCDMIERRLRKPTPAMQEAGRAMIRKQNERTAKRNALSRRRAMSAAPRPEGVGPHEAAARAAGWTHGGDARGVIYHRDDYDSWKAAVSWAPQYGPIYDTWQECCEAEGITV